MRSHESPESTNNIQVFRVESNEVRGLIWGLNWFRVRDRVRVRVRLGLGLGLGLGLEGGPSPSDHIAEPLFLAYATFHAESI